MGIKFYDKDKVDGLLSSVGTLDSEGNPVNQSLKDMCSDQNAQLVKTIDDKITQSLGPIDQMLDVILSGGSGATTIDE